MPRLLRLLPLIVLILCFGTLAATGVPLLSRTLPLTSCFAPGNLAVEGPAPTDGPRRLAHHAESDLTRIHGLQGHWMAVATYLLLPLVGVFPLVLGWRGLRRRILALFLTLALLLFLLLLLLAESFTGHFVGGMIRDSEGVPRGPFMRFAALHSIVLPVLIVIGLAVLCWIQLRVAKRADDPRTPAPAPAP